MMRRNLSRKRLKVSSGSKWTLTVTRFLRPNYTFTVWSRPWHVILCVTIASLQSLEKLILPVYLLETDDVVVKELPEILEFELPAFLRGKNRANEIPSVPSNTSQTSRVEVATCIPTCSTYLAVVEVDEEHPASNGSVWKLERAPP